MAGHLFVLELPARRWHTGLTGFVCLVLDLREVAFAAEVMTVIEHGKKQPLSIIRFTQERGAASSFYKVVETMKMVFGSRDSLVVDKSKRKMMIKTLNS